MPPRSVLKVKQNRPISAIYLGKGANSNALQSSPSSSSHNTERTSPGLPDLPEPPSPSSSVGSIHSGLPSPPATNSTGSGSTGDPATIVIRERPLSHHSNSSTSTSSGTVSTPMKRSVNESEPGVEDDDYDNDKDDNDSNDDTARLNENVMALQRVKNLAERNRMVRHLFLFLLLSCIYSQRLYTNCPASASRPRIAQAQKQNVNPHPHLHHAITVRRLFPPSLSLMTPLNITVHVASPRQHLALHHPQIQATVNGGKEPVCQLYNLQTSKRKKTMMAWKWPPGRLGIEHVIELSTSEI